MMKIVISTALVLLLSTTTVTAGEIECNPDGNQMEMNQCAADDYAAADKKLNATWKKLMAQFKSDKTATAKLKAAQKAWIAFRDAEIAAQFACDEGDIRVCWGSMYPMLVNGELQAMTETRTERLQKYLDDGLGVPMN
ncbi:MAG: lysozyme inhibitor LprI family protein [Thiothrix sp.]|uniref:lysozyme inhibitor LprI family protein n=1 Tax=Thiothrix sp. TaxID=1032 RepID=UPI002626EB08|nr:lysozyme inhibitor LprI family protein [Thiothrix sp.]MDD5394241.1 lysozyme inhibitor LprI family protein [Thiothrix sp.]